MKAQTHPHNFVIYTTDNSGFVGHHRINYGFWSFLRWNLHADENFVKNSMVNKTTYNTLKANYEEEMDIKLPYYY